MTEATSAPESTTTARSRVSSAFVGLGVGIAAGAVGLVPWLIGGGILPLQNLWATGTLPDDMPFALLPLSQYSAITVFVLILLGGVFGGLAVRLLARRREFSAWPAAIGLLIVHAFAVAQSFAVIADGLGGAVERPCILSACWVVPSSRFSWPRSLSGWDPAARRERSPWRSDSPRHPSPSGSGRSRSSSVDHPASRYR